MKELLTLEEKYTPYLEEVRFLLQQICPLAIWSASVGIKASRFGLLRFHFDQQIESVLIDKEEDQWSAQILLPKHRGRWEGQGHWPRVEEVSAGFTEHTYQK